LAYVTSSKSAITRRSILGAGIGVGAAALNLSTAAAASFDWKRFKGQHIEVAFPLSKLARLLLDNHAEFQDLTGIDVGFQQVPEQQFRQKLTIQLTSGGSDMDVVDIALTSQKRMVGKGKWLEDLKPYITDASMTAPEFDFADFIPAAVSYATQPDGRMDTLPITFYYQLFMWNKALFAAKGLAKPTTLQEMLDAAKTLHDPKNSVCGFVARGLKNANTTVWTGLMQGYGQEPIDVNGTCHTDSPDAIEAAKLYQTLDRNYGPQGVVGFNWYECQAEFIQGRAAMFLDTDTVGGGASDPKISRIVDKVGYAVYPAGPKAHVAPMYADGIAIPAGSRNKGPAWFYCQWAVSKANQARLIAGGGGSACRASAYQASKTMSARQVTDEWIEAVTESSKIASPCVPQIVSANEFRNIYGVALSNMLSGGDPAKELQTATEQFKLVYAKYG
jgi:multiple sugar transport system substrate-binding protein